MRKIFTFSTFLLIVFLSTALSVHAQATDTFKKILLAPSGEELGKVLVSKIKFQNERNPGTPFELWKVSGKVQLPIFKGSPKVIPLDENQIQQLLDVEKEISLEQEKTSAHQKIIDSFIGKFDPEFTTPLILNKKTKEIVDYPQGKLLFELSFEAIGREGIGFFPTFCKNAEGGDTSIEAKVHVRLNDNKEVEEMKILFLNLQGFEEIGYFVFK
jgi:hypothetical protein